MSTQGYSEEELNSLSEEERAAIEADVDPSELTATAAPVDLPDEEEEEEDASGDEAEGTDEEQEGGEEEGADDQGGEAEGHEDGEDPAGDDPEGEEGADDQGDDLPEEIDKDEPVNPYDHSDEAKAKIKELRDKLNDGELAPGEYDEQVDAIKSEDYRQRLQVSENQKWGKAVVSFLGKNQGYTQESNPTRFAALDSEVKRMANAGEIGNMTHLQVLQKAKANVEAAFGSVSKVEDAKDEGGKKPKPKPKAKAPDTPNLGDVPAAGVDNPKANASEFAKLDKLTGADLEAALEKMTPAQQERYLAGR